MTGLTGLARFLIPPPIYTYLTLYDVYRKTRKPVKPVIEPAGGKGEENEKIN
jgi:hypothetical protein